jgi:tetratricopeptide (TPR) repeat protein
MKPIVITFAFLGLLLWRPVSAHQEFMYSPEEARKALSAKLSEAELSSLKIPYEADEEIRELAIEITEDAHGDHQKLNRLLHYFRKRGYLDRYKQTGTHTAREVMDLGEGNCLSYANLFVAMSRSVGLQAHYLDASRVEREFGRSGSVLVEYGHILVGVRIGPEITPVDFDGKAKEFNRFEIISDLEAIADYYNNVGYELSFHRREQGGFASEDVLRAFSLATRIAPGFAKAHNNLGVAYGRAGRTKDAARAYRAAIEADPHLPAPHSNLAQIYMQQGKREKAIEHFEKAVRLDPQNAHYRYFLGRTLARCHKPAEAVDQLENAVRLDPTLYQAHMRLAELYRDQGQPDRARTAVLRVLALVPGHRDAKDLLRKLQSRAPSSSSGASLPSPAPRPIQHPTRGTPRSGPR